MTARTPLRYTYDGADPDGFSELQSGDTLALPSGLIIASTGEVSIASEGAYGWRDQTSDVIVRGSGVNDPAWATFRNSLSAYSFSASTMQQFWIPFHFNHDYKEGTSFHLHVHWAPNTTSTGTVRWGFEYSVAKGHQQTSGSDFQASTTIYVEQTISSNNQYRHFVAETAAISDGNAEPDAIILCRVFRDAAHVNDTFPDVVFGFTADVHYQSCRWATKNKAPNFYT